MANTKKADADKAVRQTVSFDPKDLERLISYCQRHPFQPSMSMVIRVALKEYLDREEKHLL